MTVLANTPAFGREYKRLIKRNPQLRKSLEQTLRQLSADPFHPRLRTHKLTGVLSGSWACSAGYDLRILFEFEKNPKTGQGEILLLT